MDALEDVDRRGDPSSPLRLPVAAPGGGYAVLIGAGLLGRGADHLREAGIPPSRVVVVSQGEVARLHAEPLLSSLLAGGYGPELMCIPEGEAHKTLDTVTSLYRRFARARLDRSAAVIALGGGMVGDVAGFVAATWMRGIPLIMAPTTLLAMVDASVGGKTAVDLPEGKNLVGAFKQPALVMADTLALATLPVAERRSGMAEILKHAILGDPQLFDALAAGERASLTAPLLARAVAVKIASVEADPHEGGRRRLLNLGHTFGHAFEAASAYSLRHGEAVAVGLIAAAHLSAALDLASPGLAGRIGRAVAAQGLPTAVSALDPTAVRAAMGVDKKMRGGRPTFIVPRDIGEVVEVEAPDAGAVDAALRAVMSGALGG